MTVSISPQLSDQAKIRNFCIIAHIDHGKSTLADRLLERTGTISVREQQDQILDNMDLERERGITIKSHVIRMNYQYQGQKYSLNLIDTPGHVDFTYEVTRCLAACEGAILIVDASQGMEAQTLSNLFLALEQDLTILPVINKIDLPSAMPDKIAADVAHFLGIDPDTIPRISAKQGLGIDEVLSQIVERVPPPKGERSEPPSALVFDSFFDSFRGVIAFVRVFSGCFKPGMQIRGLASDKIYECNELGINELKRFPTDALQAGEVGYIITGIKDVRDIKIGDTLTDDKNPCAQKVKGFREVYPMVYAGIYPIESEEFGDLGDALQKLRLNDAALSWEPETSEALGFGYRVGFLGLLHMDVVRERLERHFGVSVITTVPNVAYHVYLTNGTMAIIENPGKLPSPGVIDRIEEPFVKTGFIMPKEFVGNVMTLGEEKRGEYQTMEYITEEKVRLDYHFPLSEIMFDFYDKLKSTTRGYASMDYEPMGYRASDLVRLDILINGNPVDAFSVIIHKDKAFYWGRALCERLKDLIPRQMFEVAIQAAIGTRVIARSTVKAFRKNVIAKCYGGDISRKRKLLEKQKEGKKRMKSVGNVEIPQEAFMAVLSMDAKS